MGIVVMDDGVAAVDAQYPISAYDFRESIPNVTRKPMTHLLLTHVHGDHVFGNQAFEDCVIIAHQRLKERIEESLKNEWAPGNLERMLEAIKMNRPEKAWLHEELRIILPSEVFDERYTLDGVQMIN